MYEGLLGAYPYNRFSIVENFLPTGYSMPTYTLLGSSVVKLPFIVETSLGHEILHQWFGNSVYIDYEKGNWAEGLTTYLADHLYRAQKNEGWEYRKQILIDYRSYVTAENELPLKDFRSRVDYSSRTVGYGKVAMVFHMLKNLIGEDTFFYALKDFIHENRYRMASWDDLEASFGKAYGEDLDWYFTQWVNTTGMPELELHDFEVSQIGKEFKVHFHTTQKEKIYQFELPATIYTDTGALNENFGIKEARQSFDVMLPERPRSVVFDENYDIARKLKSEEIPPVIARLIGDESPVLILPPDGHDIYQSVIERFQNNGAAINKAEEIKLADIEASSVLILDLKNPVIEKLYGKTPSADAGFYIDVRNNPWNSQKVAGIISGKSRDEVDAAFRKIFHYGKYSKLLFDNGRNIMKEIKPTQRGVLVELSEEAAVVDISEIRSLSDVIESVSEKKIVYVGEVHDVFAHHAVQLDIISGMYKKNKKFAIGMEMFQKPFQNILDRFIDGKMGEREFLNQSEYFKRWGFDYNLYKPILDFARTECINVIAMNLQREIIKSVAHNGIDSLSDEEKKEIPPDLDFSDIEYRKRLEKIFSMHKDSEGRNFDYFYQSQILWDETMSQSIDNFLKEYPDYQIAVLAGQGHLMYGSGIPKRTHRRNSHDYAIVLIDAEVEKDIADYVVFPKHVEGITSPKLMVFLQKKEEGYEIAGFPEESVSEKAGLKEGDILLFVDDVIISSIDDIKIHLLYKARGETVKVKVSRDEEGKRREMEFEVEL
jgi:uncharacterized iron-regulated protein